MIFFFTYIVNRNTLQSSEDPFGNVQFTNFQICKSCMFLKGLPYTVIQVINATVINANCEICGKFVHYVFNLNTVTNVQPYSANKTSSNQTDVLYGDLLTFC